MLEKISFCTTCMGRRHHLEAVYGRSLEAAQSYGNVEFVLLDYHSPDALREWVFKGLEMWIERGFVRYYRTEEPQRFHMAHAKNVAHRLATGEILVNLDADNWFQPGFAEEVAALFSDGARIVANFSGRDGERRGCGGRIAIRREDFLAMGGYNEALTGWGYEDADFVQRAEALGLPRRHFAPRHALTLKHGNKERCQFISQKRIYFNNRKNKALSEADRLAGRYIANQGFQWGSAVLVNTNKLPSPRLKPDRQPLAPE